ncbi:hypothetical protein KUTeg_015206 [Tegillarca granosa]|uniref:SAP domain-containing protein n=1 Tax=Tegillarca granosa TaxID=220873 RepID=A0ABQ9EU68_TEGGR|nr:hypothetical protein KUTeg_015206 [Tegillarca granosa]
MAARKYGLTVQKLKRKLSYRGAATTGRKADLIERQENSLIRYKILFYLMTSYQNIQLTAYDRNFNFKNPVIDLPKADHVGWPVSGFKQLVLDHRLLFSKLTKEQIDGYFIYRLAGIQMTGDLKALEKGMDMFTGNKILACSVIVFVNCIFLSGIVTYTYEVKLDRLSGSPLNSECECPAGKGPMQPVST